MDPYYQEDGITLYHGDCRAILPTVTGDVTMADPPYNVGLSYQTHNDRMESYDYQAWLRSILEQCPGRSVIFFPGTANIFNVASMLDGSTLQPYELLGWHKKEFAGDKFTSGPAMCWEPIVWAIRSGKPVFNKHFGPAGRNFLVVNSTHGNPYRKSHPCPKPLQVMLWLVTLFSTPGETIIDPFCGTGTTLQAAKLLGRRAIGIDIDREYCDLAITRLQQTILPVHVPEITQAQIAFGDD